MTYLQNLWDSIFRSLPSVIAAVLLLLLAWVVASLSKYIAVKLLKKFKFNKITDRLGIADEKTGSSLEFFGKLIFFVVFLLFLPGVIDKLGMHNVSQPITSMVSQFLDYIPNIIAAVIILVVGVFVAKIIRQLLSPVLKRLNVDKIQEKAGITSSESTSISSVISYVVYVLILIPVIIASLQVLNISAISIPAIAMLNKIALFLPNILLGIAILIIGVFIAKLAGKLITSILSGVGTDTFVKRVLPAEASRLENVSASKIIGEAIKYVIILLFFVEAINVIRLEVLQFVGEAIISYLPFAISAILILIAALFLAAWVERLIKNNFTNSRIPALAAKCIIIILSVFMILNQLGIATSIVNAAFIILLSAVALAFAIAFGVGGREFASNLLKKAESKIDEENVNQEQ